MEKKTRKAYNKCFDSSANYSSAIVCSRILQLGDIDSAVYMPTVCCDETIRLIFQSRGKCGSLLFLSKDVRFSIKTVRKSELEVIKSNASNKNLSDCWFGNLLVLSFHAGMPKFVTKLLSAC